MGELVDDVQHPVLPPVMGSILDKVVGPDVIAVFWPKTDARSVIEPQPPALGLFGGDLQTLSPPEALDPLVIDLPPRPAQELRDLAIAVAAVLPGQGDHVGGQPLFVFRAPRHLALRRAVLTEHHTGAALGHPHRVPDVLDAGAPARGAQ